MPKLKFFDFLNEKPQDSLLLDLPNELVTLILSNLDKKDTQALKYFSQTSKKSNRLSQNQLCFLFNKITLDSASAPVLVKMMTKNQMSEDKFAKATLNLLREDPGQFEKVQVVLKVATELHPHVLKLEEEKTNPGCCVNLDRDDIDKMQYMFSVIFTAFGILVFLFSLANLGFKNWDNSALGFPVSAGFLLAAFLCLISRIRGVELLRSLSEAKRKLTVHLKFDALPIDSQKITRDYLPQLDIQSDNLDLEGGKPNLKYGATERTPLLNL